MTRPVTMLKQLVILSVALCLHLHVAQSLTCKLCAGSLQSDCGKNIATAMAFVECNSVGKMFGPPPNFRHPRFQTTTSLDGLLPNTLEDDANEEKRRWEAGCMYIRTKAGNATTALIARGCMFTRPGKDWCAFVEKRGKDIVECKTCTSDECN